MTNLFGKPCPIEVILSSMGTVLDSVLVTGMVISSIRVYGTILNSDSSIVNCILQMKKRYLRISLIHITNLVAGIGFEPMTFGL